MAIIAKMSSLICLTLYLSLFTTVVMNSYCDGFNPKLLNTSRILIDSSWSPAGATWYGSPNGSGSDGGACGYGKYVERAPFSSLISAGGPSLFKSGKGCGACYQVRCRENKVCSGEAVRVVITDECAGCVSESVHFDLSGTAFGAMAISHQAHQLRNVGVLQIEYTRVACNYHGATVTFQVDSGSNPNYFAVLILFENGDGNLQGVGLKEANQDSNSWISMQHSWGAVWKINAGSSLRAPFSIKLISEFGKTLLANNVIPIGWQPGKIYRSLVNFAV